MDPARSPAWRIVILLFFSNNHVTSARLHHLGPCPGTPHKPASSFSSACLPSLSEAATGTRLSTRWSSPTCSRREIVSVYRARYFRPPFLTPAELRQARLSSRREDFDSTISMTACVSSQTTLVFFVCICEQPLHHRDARPHIRGLRLRRQCTCTAFALTPEAHLRRVKVLLISTFGDIFLARVNLV